MNQVFGARVFQATENGKFKDPGVGLMVCLNYSKRDLCLGHWE